MYRNRPTSQFNARSPRYATEAEAASLQLLIRDCLQNARVRLTQAVIYRAGDYSAIVRIGQREASVSGNVSEGTAFMAYV